MKIVVLLRATHVDPTSESSLPWLGPCDRAALATGLALKGPEDSLVAVTAGPPPDDVCLEAALRAGAPRAVRLWEAAVSEADLRTLCGLLGAGLFRLNYDLVLTGQRSADWGTGALGPALAHFLGVPHVTSVIGAEASAGGLKVEHLRDDEIVSLSVQLPALLAVAEGPARALPDLNEHPQVELMNLEDTTLRIPKPIEGGPAVPQAVSRRPASLGSSSALLLALKNSGLVR
jgi:electron transfer flavoprotein alpha/beta subunit